ncbi:MAG TPA: hypothetical protein VJV79_00710 [Polyangiaceae bacterium]|nr:hypothetical protein [Polyangiaceae bacterium]
MKRWHAVTGLGLLGLSCAGESHKPAVQTANLLLASAPQSVSYQSPASFRYHPTKQATVHAERKLSDGRVLLVGKRGERWLLDPVTRGLSSGASLAPEDLIAVLDGDAGYRFVGQSGTSYDARDPLGLFVRSSAPLEPLIRVSAARRSIVGIPADRSLSRSTDGAASFTRVGPAQVSFVDVELASDGSGLALAIPEAIWLTRDEGASWSLLPGKTHGAYGLSHDRQGHVRVDTVFGPYRFADSPPRLEAGTDPASVQDLPAIAPPRGPDAAALADGRAIVLGGRYLEVAAASGRPSDYELWQGPFDGKLEASALPLLKDCRAARLTGFDRQLELACVRGSSDAGSMPISFFRSDDQGRHFEPEPFTSYGTLAGFRFALGASGALIATGLCGSPSPGCSTGGMFLRRETRNVVPRAKRQNSDPAPRRGKFELFAAATPTLAESALGLTFSLNGRVAYAIGRRSKTGAIATFVSHDGGKNFDVHDLDLVRADSDDEDQYWEHTQSSVRLESFAAAEDGSLSVVLADRHGRALIVADEQGRLLSGSKPPDERALVAAVGLRAFALSPNSRKTWESLDGGVTWQSLSRFPIALCGPDSDCDVKLRCATAGCVIGNEVSRIGWAGQTEDEVNTLPPPGRESSPLTERKVRTPVACVLDELPWQTLPGVREVPNFRDAAFGKSSFVALSSDPSRAAASMIHVFGGSRPRLQTVSLLKPVERPSEYAYLVLDQVEGAAALRYRLPEDPAKDSHLRNIELAWDNALSGQVGRARLADGGPVAPADYQLGESAQRADPDLLSIGEGGLYLRLHHTAGDVQDTWFFDGRTNTRIPPVKWPIAPNIRGRTEMARSEDTHVPLMLFGRGTAVARARRVGAEWEFDAETTGLPEPGAFGQNLISNVAYLGNASGLYVQAQAGEGARASAAFQVFRASGPVMGPKVPAPTQASLADRPGRCSATDLATTPRIDAAYLPGTRHPIVVTDNSDPPRLFLSAGAVLYGTPENACATAFDADEVAEGAAALRRERALLLLEDLEHSWLFRSIQDSNAVQYRTMKCHFEPELEVPSDVYRAPGTLVPRGG